MIELIEILSHRENCDFGYHSCEEALWLLGIVAYHHQMVVELEAMIIVLNDLDSIKLLKSTICTTFH